MRKPQRPKPQAQAPRSGARPAQKPVQELPKHTRILVGNHALAEALTVFPKACEELWLRQGWESSQDLKKMASEFKAAGARIVTKPEAALDRFSGSHQGAVLFINYTPKLDWTELERASESTLVLLDGIEDPHNLGAILRTSWLMGVSGLLIPEDRAVGMTATVHKVASGGAEHVPVQKCVNFSTPLEDLKKKGYWVFGLSHTGKKTVFDLKIPEKVVWCIGAEDKGLRSTTERLCDELVSIPQLSARASYNASVAAALALSETNRQRRK